MCAKIHFAKRKPVFAIIQRGENRKRREKGGSMPG
jgi:hypothetical protein